MNQPRCPLCGELEIHPALHAGVPWDVFYTAEYQAMLADPGVATAPAPLPCPHCGQPLPPSMSVKAPAQPAPAPTLPAPVKDTNVTDEDTPSGYMSRPKIL